MTQKRHYHPLAALRFLRKTVLLCLLPLANALLEFSLSALLTALWQDAALLLFLTDIYSVGTRPRFLLVFTICTFLVTLLAL